MPTRIDDGQGLRQIWPEKRTRAVAPGAAESKAHTKRPDQVSAEYPVTYGAAMARRTAVRSLRFWSILLLLPALLGAAALAEAGIYKWVDENGRTQFSDRPPQEAKAETVQVRAINTFEGVSVEDYESMRSSRTKESRSKGKGKSKKVVMYSAPWCGVCQRAKRFFKSKGIAFRERDIEKDSAAKREFDRMGGSGVPVILVGDKRMNGFSEGSFMNLYEM